MSNGQPFFDDAQRENNAVEPIKEYTDATSVTDDVDANPSDSEEDQQNQENLDEPSSHNFFDVLNALAAVWPGDDFREFCDALEEKQYRKAAYFLARAAFKSSEVLFILAIFGGLSLTTAQFWIVFCLVSAFISQCFSEHPKKADARKATEEARKRYRERKEQELADAKKRQSERGLYLPPASSDAVDFGDKPSN